MSRPTSAPNHAAVAAIPPDRPWSATATGAGTCGRAGRLEVDHVIGRWRTGGDPYALTNLQTLCRGCHIAKTRAERSGRRGPAPPEVAAWRDAVARLLEPP